MILIGHAIFMNILACHGSHQHKQNRNISVSCCESDLRYRTSKL